MATCPLTAADVEAARSAFAADPLDVAAVERWQQRLKDAGFYAGIVDGKPGPLTRGALQAAAVAAGVPTPQRLDFSRFEAGKFFTSVRASLFGVLSKGQVDGMEHLFREWQISGTSDYRHLAYALATSYHETGKRMQPVREGFAATDAAARAAVASLHRRGKISRNYAAPKPPHGHSYYGRGDVQLTHPENYDRMGRLLGIPLLAQPDLALDPAVSKRILIEGITRGASTRGDFNSAGRAVEDFIRGSQCDYVGARRTVNLLDKAEMIAGYARAFDRALVVAGAPKP